MKQPVAPTNGILINYGHLSIVDAALIDVLCLRFCFKNLLFSARTTGVIGCNFEHPALPRMNFFSSKNSQFRFQTFQQLLTTLFHVPTSS